VIGTGAIARQHLGCLQTLPGVTIAAVCDLSPATAEAAAERFCVPAYFADHAEMLEVVRPDVVHVTTPPTSHFTLVRDALAAGAHVIVEKPAALSYDEVRDLIEAAEHRGLTLIEDYNYVFTRQMRTVRRLAASGEFGDVNHVEIEVALEISDDHPARSLPGGVIGDFVTHLASLAHFLIGPHTRVLALRTNPQPDSRQHHDELHALVSAERGSAALSFSAVSPPDVFWLRVHGTKMRISANLFEPRLTVERTWPGPRPLTPLMNGLMEAATTGRAAIGGVVRKVSGGPGTYEGLWELLGQTYAALTDGTPMPVTHRDIDHVNRLVADLLAGRGND
jgi:predicted dehydrogenase